MTNEEQRLIKFLTKEMKHFQFDVSQGIFLHLFRKDIHEYVLIEHKWNLEDLSPAIILNKFIMKYYYEIEHIKLLINHIEEDFKDIG